MAKQQGKHGAEADQGSSRGTFGRYAGPATLILSSLADGAKHGYALTNDIEAFAPECGSPPALFTTH